MALPELTLPAGTPAFLADGHSIELTPAHADVPMMAGHARKRRVFTAPPRVVDVALQLSAAQALEFTAWYEGPLQAGVLPFAAQVQNQGSGLLWWSARFVDTYTATPNDSGSLYRIEARLLLTGSGSATGPVLSSLASDVVVALNGSAGLTVPSGLSSDVVVALTTIVALSSDVFVRLVSIQDGATPSAVDYEKRWIWMRYPYARGRTSDVTDVSEFDQRSWMEKT